MICESATIARLIRESPYDLLLLPGDCIRGIAPALLETALNDEQAAIDMVNIWSHSSIAQKPSFPGPGFYAMGGARRLKQRIAALNPPASQVVPVAEVGAETLPAAKAPAAEKPAKADKAAQTEAPTPAVEDKPEDGDKPPTVVSLDAFRKKT